MVAVLLASTASATAAAPPEPPVQATDCLNLSAKQLQKRELPTTVTPIDCAELHTYEIAEVLTVPAKYASKGRDSMEVRAWQSIACAAVLTDEYHSPRTHPFLNVDWRVNHFLPSKAQWANGARWMICGGDQGKWSAKKGYYATYAVKGSILTTDRYHPFCGKWAKDNVTFALVSCDSAGARRAVDFQLVWGDSVSMKYPGKKALYKRANYLRDRDFDRRYGWTANFEKKAWLSGGGRWVTFYEPR